MSVTTSGHTADGTFSHGLHPPERKGLAANAAIEVLPTPEKVQIALLQHLGAPCEATHKPRTEVAVGDVVGQAEAFVSAPVHASVDGATVKASMTTLPNGRHVAVVPIKSAEEQNLQGDALLTDVFGGSWPMDDLQRYEAQEITSAARNAGLVGLGGAAFPTHVKLTRNAKKPIDLLVLNGCECEPYLTADYRLMLEFPEPVVAGALLAQKATGADKLIIAVEDNKPAAVAALRRASSGTGAEVRVLKTKYPQGSEKQLVVAVAGREVPTGGLPLDVGVVVLNVGTAAALARAVCRGKPLTHRVVTVSGAGIREPKNLLAPFGASYGDLIKYCGGLTEDAAAVVAGGPMMGFAVDIGDNSPNALKVPVTKGTSGITVLTTAEVERGKETTCVRCGRCVDVCPMRLMPTRLALAARNGNVDDLTRYHIIACMECGCCGFICPAKIPLVQLIRTGKVMLQKK